MMKKIVVMLFILLVSCTYINSINYDTDYARYHDAYKKALFSTGQNQPSDELMETLMEEWDNLTLHYRLRSPYKDKLWINDTDEINATLNEAKMFVGENKLAQAHEKLEHVRQVWQKIWTRNNIENRHYHMTRFHDLMEESIANVDNSYCVEMMDTWLKIKRLNEDIENKDEFHSMHMIEQSYINKFCDEPNEENGNSLKSNFVKIYIKFG